jgi:dTDP-glucose 4,6-dehydratase
VRVVVAGGAGFLGSHLCDRLLDRGDEVVVVDDFSTGSIANIAHHDAHPRFRFIRADVSKGVPVDGMVDAVANFASPASPPAYLARPLQTLAVGSEGTRHLLELSERCGARFIQASTSEVYGDPAVHPQREDYWGNVNPIGPRSVYDESKRFAEALTLAHHRTNGANVGVARIFNTYGPRLMPLDGRVVSNFISQALQDQALTVYGDGTQSRSLCYVDDLIAGVLKLMESDVTGPVNLGNPNEITVIRLAHKIITLTRSRSIVEFRDLPVDDPTRRCPNITFAREVLGWSPVVELEDGLMRTIETFNAT